MIQLHFDVTISYLCEAIYVFKYANMEGFRRASHIIVLTVVPCHSVDSATIPYIVLIVHSTMS